MTDSTVDSIVRLAALREAPLDVAEVVATLDDEASGGLTLFVGSAHPSAEAKLREVCERIADEYDVHGVAAVHRTGSLAIGDIAVVIATTAAHRGQAFDASRTLIDTLKAEVPIWKHQRFGDGTEEWVGSP